MIQIECPESLNQLMKNYIESNRKIEQMIENSDDNQKGLRLELKFDEDSPCLTFIITPNKSEYEVELRYINHIIKKLSNIYARLINQYKFRYQTVFSVVFDKQNDDDEKELFIDLNISHNLTQSDIDKIGVLSTLRHKIQDEEMKEFDWQFYKINSMTVSFYKDSNIVFNFENIDKQSICDYLNSGEI